MSPDPDSLAIVGGLVALPDGRIEPRTVVVRDGLIAGIDAPRDSGSTSAGGVLDAEGRLVTPGLIDLHVHGALGHSFDEASPAATRRIIEHYAAVGVTTLQASLVSATTDDLNARLTALDPEAVAASGGDDAAPTPRARILGAHLEGPFLADGQRGAHDRDALRVPSERDRDVLLRHAARIRMITIAPERAETLELARELQRHGVVIAVGHSDATRDDLARARDAGARHFTHLWSGMGALRRDGAWRVPGLIDLALASTGMTAEVIADGRHLPPELLEIARRCFGDDLVVVSDATPGTGMPDGYRYQLGDVDCVVEDGVGMVVGIDSFGGSTTALPGMLAHLVDDLGWPVATAVAAATTAPARVAGVNDRIGAIRVGAEADLVIWDEGFRARSVVIGGRETSVGVADL